MRTVVIGGGIMGAGIAFDACCAGFTVTIVETAEEHCASARERVEHYEHRARTRGKIGRAHVRTPVTRLSRMPSSA